MPKYHNRNTCGEKGRFRDRDNCTKTKRSVILPGVSFDSSKMDVRFFRRCKSLTLLLCLSLINRKKGKSRNIPRGEKKQKKKKTDDSIYNTTTNNN